MPIITCDIREGRTREQVSRLAKELTRAVSDATGSGVDNVFLVVREMPAFNFVDAGEHVVPYVAGPGGIDLAAQEQAKDRGTTT